MSDQLDSASTVEGVTGLLESGSVSTTPVPPRRILCVEANEDGTVGGSHQALYDLVRHLDRSRYEPVLLFYQDNRFAAALRHEGFEVHLFAGQRECELRVRLHGTPLRRWLDFFGAITRRARFLREHALDAVHINNSPAVGNDDWLPAAKLRRIPILANAMGDAEGARGSMVHRWLFRSFDRVLPISAFMHEAVLASGIPSDRVTEIRLGVDLDAIHRRVGRSRDEVRTELGVGTDQLLITMIGNVREWKGQHVLLEALGALDSEERARLRVVFAGAVHEDGQPYKDRLLATERRLCLGEVVSWLGPREDVPDLFAAADLAVHCSVIPEPFGLVVTEAMALGTPVAATDKGGPAEVVTESSGWLYSASRPDQLAQVLRTALNDPDLLERKSAGAVRRAADFSVRSTVERTVQAYDAVFSRP